MLGTELALLFESRSLPYIATDRELDITDREALLSFAEKQQAIGWIINCAAYTAVDKAEDDSDNCRLINTTGAKNIASCAKKIGARLVHISTDYVFNGRGNKPYTEEDKTDPIGVYGLSKRDGEIKILEENSDSFIIRTAWLYGRHGNNFVHTMLRLMQEKETLSVVNDQYGCPTWAFDLAETIVTLMRFSDTKKITFGIYHYTNEGEITWFDFAKEIYSQGRSFGILSRDCKVMPCTSADFPAKVRRPAYSVLDKTKIKKTLEITIPAWDESLKEFFKKSANYAD